MATEIIMSCDVSGETGFHFLVTSHEKAGGNLSIHGNGLDASIECTATQATQLINELQKAVIRLEAHRLANGNPT